MIRAQQMNQSNDNKSTFERRPSQRFASRRSRMDRTRPNIISVGNKTINSNNNNNNNNSTSTNNNRINHSTNISNNQSVGNNKINESNINNKQSEAQQQKISQQQQSSAIKSNTVMNSRHQLSHGKPVKPPTVPPSVSFSGITQQQVKHQDHNQQATKSNQSTVNINNNNIQQQSMSDNRRKTDFVDPETLSSSKISIDPFDHSNNQLLASQNIDSSLHSHSKSQPQLPTKSHHNYINYKPPDAQPPPPPKAYEQQLSKQLQRMTKSEEEQDQQALAANRRATRSTNNNNGGGFEQISESLSAPNGTTNQRIHHHQQQGELLSSSSMPPPPPPPHTAPRSISSRDMMSSQRVNNKQQQHQHQHQHSQSSGLIKPICVTEL